MNSIRSKIERSILRGDFQGSLIDIEKVLKDDAEGNVEIDRKSLVSGYKLNNDSCLQ